MKYGLLGERLSHSFSPELHRRLGYPGSEDYELIETEPEALASFLADRRFDGLNVTIPYKQAVIPLLDRVSPEAEAIGAVNTVVNRNGVLCGYNTDFGGLKALLRSLGCGDLRGKTVLIAGTGGTSRTALAAARDLGAAEVWRMSRDPAGEPDVTGYAEAYEKHADAALLINTTPVGMYPRVEDCPVDLDRLPALEAVADVIYNPVTTELVRRARDRGLRAGNGLLMLVWQAALAAERFTGQQYHADAVNALWRQMTFEKTNLVLTGMPGSGKSTLGRLLARRLGRPFHDSDTEVEKAAGMPVPELIRKYGEAAFRERETAALLELCTRPGQVIATGGGAVLREENRQIIARGGTLVFLDRPLEDLPVTASRPLSDTREKLNALYAARYPVYRAAGEHWNGLRAPVTGTPRDTVEEIVRRLQT